MTKRATLLLLALASLPLVFGGLGLPATAADQPIEPLPEDGWRGTPDLERTSGRFLSVSGLRNAGIGLDPDDPNPVVLPDPEGGEDPRQLVLALIFPEAEIGPTDVRLAIFDADTAGLWDQRSDLPPVSPEPGIVKPYDTRFRVYADPNGEIARQLADGTRDTVVGAVPVVNSMALADPILGTNAVWCEILNEDGRDAAKNEELGLYVYTLRVTLEAGPSPLSEYELNGFKVASTGTPRLPRGTLLGFVGGVVDIRTISGLAQSEDPLPGVPYRDPATNDLLTNGYAGDWSFPFQIDFACDDLVFFEADSDWNQPIPAPDPNDPETLFGDQNPTGIPPDDGGRYVFDQEVIDNTSLKIPLPPADQVLGRHGLLWEVVDPDGVIRAASYLESPAHPSFNAGIQKRVNGEAGQDPATPFRQSTLSKTLLNANPGEWDLRWRGVDARNAIWIKASGGLGPSLEGETISGRVWCDGEDAPNGAWNPAVDMPLANATVRLGRMDLVVAPVDVTTNASGVWETSTSVLVEGTWAIVNVTPDPNTDTVFTPLSPYPKEFEVDPCDEQDDVDCPGTCRVEMGRIIGTVYCDNDANARFQDPPDTPLATVTVEIRDADDVVVDSPVTNAGGDYASIMLPIGDYTVSINEDQTALDGTEALSPVSVEAEVFANQETRVDFRRRCAAEVSGHVIRETRPCDGTWQRDVETGIANVTVALTLLDEDGFPTTETRSTTTNAIGFYAFLDVDPGTYDISVNENQVNVVRLAASSPTTIGDVQVAPLSTNPDNDFFFCPGAVRVRVFKKARGEACLNVVEDGDAPIPGVKVVLTGTNPTTTPGPFEVETNDEGVALFDNLDADTYVVTVNGNQAGLIMLEPAPGAAMGQVELPAGDLEVFDSVWCENTCSITGHVRGEAECVPWWRWNGKGIPRVRVEIRRESDSADGPAFMTRTTDAQGFYAFLEISQGAYVVNVPEGQVPLALLTGRSPNPVEVEECPAEIDFVYGSAGIRVEVLVDVDCGGTPDSGLVIPVNLKKLDEPQAGLEISGETNGDGILLVPGLDVNGLLPGRWEVSVPRRANLIAQTPLTQVVRAPVCGPVTVRFLFCGTCALEGRVVREKRDCDGVIQRDEEGIEGVLVTLVPINPSGAARTDLTDENGNYVFRLLPRGTYVVGIRGNDPMLVDLKPSSPTRVTVVCVPPDVGRVDFTLCPPGRICGSVFVEPLGDCDGELGRDDDLLGGVRVVLRPLDPAGPETSVFTRDDGSYCFLDLDPGTYAVQVDSTSIVVENLSATTATVVRVQLEADEEEEADFGFARQALGGIVFRQPMDLCDEDYDPDVDTGLPGLRVTAVKLDQPRRGLAVAAVTSAAGTYLFRDIPSGRYEVRVEGDVPPGLVPATPTIVTTAVPVCDATRVNFAFCPEPRCTICGTVFREPWDDCDGIYNRGDVGIPGVTVRLEKLDEPNAGRSTEQVTDDQGDYCFRNLPAGRYRVWVPGRQPQLVNLTPSTPTEQRVVCRRGEDVEDVDFGYCPPCPKVPCCEGDLHEVVVLTKFWIDDCIDWYDVYAFFKNGCAEDSKEIDYAGVYFRGDFPGQVSGYNDVLSIENVHREGHWLYVRLRLTAQGCAFPRGFFGHKRRSVVVTVNGQKNVGCAIFRCEYVRPGSRFTWSEACGFPECEHDGASRDAASTEPRVLSSLEQCNCPEGCDARYLVLDTYGWENWLECEGRPECRYQSERCVCGYNLVELELDYWVKAGTERHEYGVRLRKWGKEDIDGVDLHFTGSEWHGRETGWGGYATLTDVYLVSRGQHRDLYRARVLVQACDRPDGNPRALPEQLAVDSTLDDWTHDYWLDMGRGTHGCLPVGRIEWEGEFTGVTIRRWLNVLDAAWCDPVICHDCPEPEPCSECPPKND